MGPHFKGGVTGRNINTGESTNLFPSVNGGQKSMQNLNGSDFKSGTGSNSKKLSQSLAVKKNQDGKNFADQVDTNTTTNIVHVDFIGAEYVGNGLGGFDKKMPKGYNGGKATGKK